MKKNRMMRAASALLVAVLMTTCTISGTFAKYTSSETATSTARVAKWGVTITGSGDTAFQKQYKNGDLEVIVDSSTEDKVVAPGTSGTFANATISGTAEVALKVETSGTLTLEGWTVGGKFYCPLIIAGVNGALYENKMAEFKADVEAAIAASQEFAPGATLSIPGAAPDWSWTFEGVDDTKDTALGKLNPAPTVSLTYTVSATQINDLT